ncbi:MAG: cysteine desulfurase [Clostridia bacterium]|nr:cysteine desulfurase [Clostridia bacterium]
MIYFDNSATTPPCEAATAAALGAMRETWGNPSSTHSAGLAARRVKEAARREIALSLGIKGASSDKIIFTSGGTEANDLAILGSVHSKERPFKGSSRGTVVISDGEHASVAACAAALEKEGFAIYRIPTVGGALDLDDLKRHAGGDIILASIMRVNNETGAIYDVRGAFDIIRAASPSAIFHTDCVQAYMKIPVVPFDLGADMITLSAHKIFSVKGAGALYVSGGVIKKKALTPLFFGGGQEEGFRSGTEAIPAIASFGAAVSLGMKEQRERTGLIAKIGEYALKKVGAIEGIRLNLPPERLPSILNLTVRGIKSETLLNYLSGEGICVSKSSACSSRSREISAALTAFGLPESDADSSIRLSFSHLNTEDEIDRFCEVLTRGVGALARIRA